MGTHVGVVKVLHKQKVKGPARGEKKKSVAVFWVSRSACIRDVREPSLSRNLWVFHIPWKGRERGQRPGRGEKNALFRRDRENSSPQKSAGKGKNDEEKREKEKGRGFTSWDLRISSPNGVSAHHILKEKKVKARRGDN